MNKANPSRNRVRRQSGSLLVFTAIMLVVILGMVALAFDIGRLMIAKQRAQNVCDAAVLAGAYYLTGYPASTRVDSSSGTATGSDGSAAVAAKDAAAANNAVSPSWKTMTVDGTAVGVTVTFPPYPASSGTVVADDGTQISIKLGQAIRAQAIIKVPATFARIFGFTSTDVYAQATAIVAVQSESPTPVTVTATAFPWAVTDTTIWNADTDPPSLRIGMGDQFTLKITNPGDPGDVIGSGNFLAVAYGNDRGASAYKNRIVSTTPVTFTLDQEIDLYTETGNMSGPTEQGLEERLSDDIYPYPSANDSAWNSWLNSYDPSTGIRADTRRIGVVPIVKDPGGNIHGRKSLELIGFAGVFVEGFENVTVGDNTYYRLIGRFTNGVYTADGIVWLDPSVNPPYSSTITSVRLLN
ncbi:Tad domain-containing protein [bacterium]|nr:Tad domain-containing protein [bacterium]